MRHNVPRNDASRVRSDSAIEGLPLLPLVLWEAPAALEMLLAQEGVPFVRYEAGRGFSESSGRFVILDPRSISQREIQSKLTDDHVVINSDELLEGESELSWDTLLDTRSSPMGWSVATRVLVERVSRVPRAFLRNRILTRLREKVTSSGGIWIRLAHFPYPYRSAFNLRVDLDEPVPEDYFRFARARQGIEDCTTHFVSTKAYVGLTRVMDDLRTLDTQSHGHHHHVYRDASANDLNLNTADRLLRGAGIAPTGFAGPHGRWNRGLDRVLTQLGYDYASEFQVGYDDVPFYPWVGSRFSSVLQIPVHPVCEGLFLDAGLDSGVLMGAYFANVVRRKLSSGEPAFIYGHPEYRLGRYPEVVRSVARVVTEFPLAWRVTLTEFARWWRWRSERSISVVSLEPGLLEITTDNWNERYPMAVDVVRGGHAARLRLDGPRRVVRLSELVYERQAEEPAIAPPVPLANPRPSLKSWIREALDWETVTPIEEIGGSMRGWLKRELRKRRDRVA